MSKSIKTKPCEYCNTEFPYTVSRGRPKEFCSSACKQAAYRLRHAKPATLGQLQRSQKRADRKRDFHVQRPQELAGKNVVPLPGNDGHGFPDPGVLTGRRRLEGSRAVDGGDGQIRQGWG